MWTIQSTFYQWFSEKSLLCRGDYQDDVKMCMFINNIKMSVKSWTIITCLTVHPACACLTDLSLLGVVQCWDHAEGVVIQYIIYIHAIYDSVLNYQILITIYNLMVVVWVNISAALERVCFPMPHASSYITPFLKPRFMLTRTITLISALMV